MSILQQFSNPRRTFIILALFAGVLCLGMTQTAWAEYPDKNIKVILHVSPGGGTDTMARLVLRYVGEKLGTNFVIENHSGAGGQIGYTTLSMAPPDGYTIGTITTMSIVTHELTREGLSYTLRDNFAPIARVVMDASGIFVPVDSPLKSLDDLILAAKKDPGALSWGGTMLWGAHHIHLALLEKAAGIKLTYVPFDGASESRAALLGGHLDVVAGGGSEFASQVKEGKLRGLALGGPKRSTLLPDVPTYKELGYDVEIGSNRGFAAPAGTPQEYIDILSKAFKEVMEDPVFLADAEKIGIAPTLNYMNAEDFRSYLLNLQENMREMLKENQE
jgi:tripartite-type tricarboxylate transporter receptor subunit TctC